MEIKKFIEVISRKTGLEYFDKDVNGLYKYIYNFRKEYPEQKTIVYIDGLEEYTSKFKNGGSLLNGFKLYGILDSKDKEIVYDYNFVCILTQEIINEGRILSFIENYNKKYLEEGYTVNQIFIDYDMVNEEEYDILTSELNRLTYPIFPINISSEVRTKTIGAQIVENKLNLYRSRNFTNFLDITEDIKKLDKDYTFYPNKVINTFNNLVNKIRKESKERKNLVIYSSLENEVYSIVAAHCNYYNSSPIEFMFCKTGGDYRILLTELYYDNERMLLCDRIRYLQQQPSILFKVTDFGPSLLFVDEKNFSANAYVTSYNNILSDEEEDVITIEEIDFSGNGMYDVVSFFDMYPGLKTDESSDQLDNDTKKKMEYHILAEDRKCRKDLNNFYFKIKDKFKEDTSNLQILTPCNCVFLRHKSSDEIYVAYIKSDDEFNFKIKAKQLALALPIPKFCNVEMGLDKAKYWLPYNASLDIKIIVKQLNKSLGGRLNKYLYGLEPSFMGNEESTTVYRYLYFSPSGQRMTNIDTLDYFNYLLNNRNSVSFRRENSPLYGVNFEEELLPQLDCMGGLNVIKIRTVANKIKLTENTFKEMPVKYENR